MPAVALGWWSFIVAQPAFATEGSPVRLCADAAAGTEVEVCLRLAVAHPEELDGIAAALIAHLDRSEAPDRDLLEAMLLLSGPQGADGVARLVALRDPRAVPPLLHAARVREDPIATMALHALAAWPEAWPALARFIWEPDRERPVARRTAAAVALARTGDPRAAALVENALVRPGIPLEVYRRGVEALAETFPDRAAPTRGLTSEASLWLTAGAGIGLGFGLAAVTQTARSELDLVPVAAVTGAVTGATFGWVYGRARPLEAGDGALVTVSGVTGIGVGGLVGRGLFPEAPQAPFIGGLVGEGLGFGIAAALTPRYDGDARQTFAATMISGLSTVAADQWMVAADVDRRRVRPLVDAAVLSTSFALATARAPRLRVSPRDTGLLVTGGILGVATGTLLPVDTDRRASLVVGSAAAGTALGLALSGPLEVPTDVWFVGLASGAAGASIGTGMGLLLDQDRPLAQGLGLGFGAVGFGIGATIGSRDPNPVDDRDVVFASVATGWAAGQGVVFARIGDPEITPREWGGILMATGVVSATSATLNLELDVPVPSTLAASSVGMWGAFAGGALGRITRRQPEITGLVGTNLGLITGGLLVSDLVGTPPLVIGVANAGAIAGGVVTGLGTAAVTSNADAILGGTLIGSVGGAVAGTALGVRWHRSGERRDVAFFRRRPMNPRVQVVPMGAGLRVVVDQW
ncbi:MAG: hypothetical protein AAGA48_23530 [Myxococcota bacterium]